MSKIGRNAPCPCGSGKKYKRCCLPQAPNKKSRSEYVYATTREEVSEISLSFDPLTGAVEFNTPVIDTYAQTTYERESPKGPKVINKVPLNSKALHFASDPSIFEDYDLLFAIDTNTRNLSGAKHSVGGFLYCELQKHRRAIKWLAPFGIEFTDEDKPENFSWKVVIEHILYDPALRSVPRIGMLVDSDYGKMDNYNKRMLPIWGDVSIPTNVRLIYASTDTGKDFLINKLISEADKFSNVLLDHIENGNIPPEPSATKSPRYRKLFGKPESEQAPYKTLQRSWAGLR